MVCVCVCVCVWCPGVCQKMQNKITRAIRRSRQMGVSWCILSLPLYIHSSYYALYILQDFYQTIAIPIIDDILQYKALLRQGAYKYMYQYDCVYMYICNYALQIIAYALKLVGNGVAAHYLCIIIHVCTVSFITELVHCILC